ncbi:hypothetical protein GQS52_19620 [Streptomyces sp. SCUT-3]|uniref:hypothetical protein n=1 Tax=Streptomyces TaxID=1883 RepID=UPI0015F84C5F|nr:hypothetical protein [Streptomyces sp. SCUT-3]QMV23613.1 hypothetical protein GQS52_19620 [Streptomyces sp. SCUT-3]
MRLSAREWDIERFGPGARRWLVGLSAVLFLVVLMVVVPGLWRWLDSAPFLGAAATAVPLDDGPGWGRLYTAAYVSSLAPGLVAVGAHLSWAVRRRPGGRVPTPLLVAVGALAVCQCAFVAAGWGEPATGDALGESLERAGVGVWGRDVVERGWYVGFAALAAWLAAAVFASTRRTRSHTWFAVLLVPATVLPWLLLSGPHLFRP